MRILELKWSDESGWKVVRPLKLDEVPEHAIENAAEQWAAQRTKYGQNHPHCEFRVVKVIA